MAPSSYTLSWISLLHAHMSKNIHMHIHIHTYAYKYNPPICHNTDYAWNQCRAWLHSKALALICWTDWLVKYAQEEPWTFWAPFGKAHPKRNLMSVHMGGTETLSLALVGRNKTLDLRRHLSHSFPLKAEFKYPKIRKTKHAKLKRGSELLQVDAIIGGPPWCISLRNSFFSLPLINLINPCSAQVKLSFWVSLL